MVCDGADWGERTAFAPFVESVTYIRLGQRKQGIALVPVLARDDVGSDSVSSPVRCMRDVSRGRESDR